MLNFNKQFGDFSVSASAGTSFTDTYAKQYTLNAGGDRYIPNYFALENSTKNGSG